AAAAAEKWGTTVIPVYGDVTDWDSVHRVMRECYEKLGRIDILVNSAVTIASIDFTRATGEDIDYTVRGTLLGPLFCTRAVLEYMIPHGSGRIINIGSEAANTAMPGLIMYGSCKAAINGFTSFLGKELGGHGIHVLGVNPGSMWGPNRPFPPEGIMGLY